jgi:hypothetical protein
MNLYEIRESLKPIQHYPVRELLQAAGVDVSSWERSIDGKEIENPNSNTYKNSRWSFGEGNGPLVACIWFSSILARDNEIVYEDSLKQYMEELGNLLASPGRKSEEKIRLRNKIGKADAFNKLISHAFRKRLPVRIIVLSGTRADEDDSAISSSKASLRLLDPAEWYIHSYSVETGFFTAKRGIPLAPLIEEEPGQIADPLESPALQILLSDSSLSDTEKDALVKVRVGQGPFRDALIQRWGGCSVPPQERLSVSNGLLLTPNLDRLFDRGLISFDDSFKILISPKLSKATEIALNIHPNMQLRSKKHLDLLPFLTRHRKETFISSPFLLEA